jgi:hypothetical protein
LYDNHRHKNIGVVDFASILAKDMLENTFPDENSVAMTIPAETNSSASDETAVELNSSIESAKEFVSSHSMLDESTLISALTELSSSSPSQALEVNANSKKHQLVISEEWVNHSNHNEQRSGKRRKRGKCKICSKNTSWYCPDCPPKGGSQKAWICGTKPECRENHMSQVN